MGIGSSTKNYQETIQKVVNENISSSIQSTYSVTSNETSLEVDCAGIEQQRKDALEYAKEITTIYGERYANGEITEMHWAGLNKSAADALQLSQCGATNVTINSVIQVDHTAEEFAKVVQESISTLGADLEAELKQQPGFFNSINNEVKAYQSAVNSNIVTNQQKIYNVVQNSSKVKVVGGVTNGVLLENSVFAVTRTLMMSKAVQTAAAALSAKIKTTIAPADDGLAWLLWTVLGILAVVLLAVLTWYLIRRSRARARARVVVLE